MVEQIPPLERFKCESFRGTRGRFYTCAACGGKTMVKSGSLNAFAPAPSIFPSELQDEFSAATVPGHHAAFDFHCKTCGRPVRLLFWERETGMGGYWYCYLIGVLELPVA